MVRPSENVVDGLVIKGIQCCNLHGNNRVRVYQMRVLKRIFGLERDDVTG
jgi:hypothetical protein